MTSSWYSSFFEKNMTMYAFNMIKYYRDPATGEKKHVYGRYINDKLWCVWFPTSNEKRAHEILTEKARELNGNNEASRVFC